MISESKIPIENIYYMFCYAWNRFTQSQAIGVGSERSPDLPNLLAKVFLLNVQNLFRRGLEQDYEVFEEDLPTVRGKIDLSKTVRLKMRRQQKAACQFDDLSRDTLSNQILKACMRRLGRCRNLAPNLAHQLRVMVFKFGEVSDIDLQLAHFSRVRMHRNIASYDLSIKIALLIHESLIPSQNGDEFSFDDVARDERKMPLVFQAFVRNFYHHEQNEFKVEGLRINWDATALEESSVRLPVMEVDAYLRSGARRIILDAKYYQDALQHHYGSTKFKSHNLYQLFSYLKNVAGSDREFADVEGILLYPEVDQPLKSDYLVQGHKIRLATINLNQLWPRISADLLDLLH